MPSPLGHAVAGVAIAWCAEAIRRQPLGFRPGATVAVTCAALAIAPDVDLLYLPVHRTMTHSLLASAVAGIAAAVVLRRRRRTDAWIATAACAAAYASHLLLDWLGGDTKIPAGIQLLWPFSDRWFISHWGVFGSTDLGGFFRPPVMMANALAVLREGVLLTPIAGAAYLWRRHRLGPLAGQPGRWPSSSVLSEDPRS